MLVMYLCFSTLAGMLLMLRSNSPAKSGSEVAASAAADDVIVSSPISLWDYVLMSRSLGSRVGRHRVAQQASRQFDAFARHVIGRACPLFGIGRLVTEIAGIALFRQQPEHLAPRHHALAGRQTVGRPRHAGDGIGRKIAVLKTENLFCRHALESAAGRAAAGKVIGVDEVPAVF